MEHRTESQVAPASRSYDLRKRARSPPSPCSCKHGGPSSARCHHQHRRRTTISRDGRTTSTTPSLAAFLCDDVQPEGARLLLPFLTFMERLRLSECSKDLIGYRTSMSKVKVVPHPAPVSRTKRGLRQLLLDKRQYGGLRHLRVGHESMLYVLDLASEGCFARLKTLDLSYLKGREAVGDEEEAKLTPLNKKDEDSLMKALTRGWLRELEELNLRYSPLSEEGLQALFGALEAGMCPSLRRLNLYKSRCRGRGAHACNVATALASGHLRNLQELDLSHNYLGLCWGGATIAMALQGVARPELVKLDLSFCCLGPEDGVALMEAMQSGALVKLEDLGLEGNYIREGFTAIFGALGAGRCPSLKRLDLAGNHLSAESATVLGSVLASGSCLSLQELDLSNAFGSDESAVLLVLQAIKEGGAHGVPNLRSLNLLDTLMVENHGEVLGEAIQEGALAKLEELLLRARDRFTDEGVVPIIEGLRSGGCPNLQGLTLSFGDMGEEGGFALAQALASGHLDRLRRFSLLWVDFYRDRALREVITGLRRCHQLRELRSGFKGIGAMAGEALVQALEAKAWPDLEKLRVAYDKSLLHDKNKTVKGLAKVLKRRAKLCPRLKAVELLGKQVNLEGDNSGGLAQLLADLEVK